jgi:hypothetical protein
MTREEAVMSKKEQETLQVGPGNGPGSGKEV